MVFPLFSRLAREVAPRALFKIAVNLCGKNLANILRFERRQRCGEPFFPGFMILSLTNRCNLSCQGCWVSSNPPQDLHPETLRGVIRECLAHGSSYFGLVGGEPLLFPGLFECISEFPGAYFQVFTNGTLLTPDIARTMKKLGNVTPLISIEGIGHESDRRRNGHGVYASALEAIATCRRFRLLTGVASSVCTRNIDQVVRDEFVEEMISRGVHYLWYYIYRPVGPRPHPELALNPEQIRRLRRFMVEARVRHPIGIIDTYWDADGRAVCPGAMGLSHHLNPSGDIEFCPPLQFSFDRIKPGDRFSQIVRNSSALADLRTRIAGATRGCILLNDPEGLSAWLTELNAQDSSGRGQALAELLSRPSFPCHALPGEEIPEKSWFYRLAKRFGFFGFSAYG